MRDSGPMYFHVGVDMLINITCISQIAPFPLTYLNYPKTFKILLSLIIVRLIKNKEKNTYYVFNCIRTYDPRNQNFKWLELVSWTPVGDGAHSRALTTELLGTSEKVLKKSLAIITDLVS